MDESKQLLSTTKGDRPPDYSPPQPQVVFYPAPVVIAQPPIKYGNVERPPRPPDYFWLGIFSIVCCFWPLGIVAVVFSVQSMNRYNDGDYTGAKTYSSRACKMGGLAILIHVLVPLCGALAGGVVFLSSS